MNVELNATLDLANYLLSATGLESVTVVLARIGQLHRMVPKTSDALLHFATAIGLADSDGVRTTTRERFYPPEFWLSGFPEVLPAQVVAIMVRLSCAQPSLRHGYLFLRYKPQLSDGSAMVSVVLASDRVEVENDPAQFVAAKAASSGRMDAADPIPEKFRVHRPFSYGITMANDEVAEGRLVVKTPMDGSSLSRAEIREVRDFLNSWLERAP